MYLLQTDKVTIGTWNLSFTSIYAMGRKTKSPDRKRDFLFYIEYLVFKILFYHYILSEPTLIYIYNTHYINTCFSSRRQLNGLRLSFCGYKYFCSSYSFTINQIHFYYAPSLWYIVEVYMDSFVSSRIWINIYRFFHILIILYYWCWLRLIMRVTTSNEITICKIRSIKHFFFALLNRTCL